MAGVLAKPFGVFDANAFAALGRPRFHRSDVVVDAVLLQHPAALAFMGREHPPLRLHEARNVDREIGTDLVALAVASTNGVHEIDVRYSAEDTRLACTVVRYGHGEARVAH